MLRLSGRGHSAAIHSTDPQLIMEYGAAVEVLRVAVNVGSSLGSAGLETNLAPTMTIGTGFFGGSSVAENLHPSHLVQWTRLAYNRDPAEPFGDFAGLAPWQAPGRARCPRTRWRPTSGATARRRRGGGGQAGQPGPFGTKWFLSDAAALREEIRRLILEELSQLAGG